MGQIIDNAVSWALRIAEDDSHGYDQESRWGPDYDCSSLVITAYENAGIPVKTNGATYTGNMVNVFLSCGFKDVTGEITLSTGAGLIKGDVLWKDGHTEMVCSAGRIVGASANENGEATGGQTGDQTGAEIRERDYYNAPWTTVLRYPEQTINPIPTTAHSGNRYLSTAEMRENARYIAAALLADGWTLQAICGMLGNFETESTINPGIWESLTTDPETYYAENGRYPGFGLVQWTPYTKYTEWCESNGLEPSNMDSALARIKWELDNREQYIPTTNYPETFAEFKESTKSPYYLGMAFLLNYERPRDQNQTKRGEQAEAWYIYLTETDPVTPGGGGGGSPGFIIRRKRGFNFILFSKNKRRNFYG